MKVQQLFEALGTVEQFNATSLSAQQVAELFKLRSERDFNDTFPSILEAGKVGWFSYSGRQEVDGNQTHTYQFGVNDHEEGLLSVLILIELDSKGVIRCHIDMPVEFFDSELECAKYFKRLRTKFGYNL